MRETLTTFVQCCKDIIKKFRDHEARAKKAVSVIQETLATIQNIAQSHLCNSSTLGALLDCVSRDASTPPTDDTIFHFEHKCMLIRALCKLWKANAITEEGFTILLQKLPRESDFRIGGWSVDPKGYLIENCTPNAHAGPGTWCRTYTTHHHPDGTSRDMGSMSDQVM